MVSHLTTCRAPHWCLLPCPGQVEFVSYSWRQVKTVSCLPRWPSTLHIFLGFTFENVCKFCGLASKFVLESMLSHASTMFYLVFKWNIMKHTIFSVCFSGVFRPAWQHDNPSPITSTHRHGSHQDSPSHLHPREKITVGDVQRFPCSSGSLCLVRRRNFFIGSTGNSA